MSEDEMERIANMSNEELARVYWAHFPRRVALARAEVHWRRSWRRSGIPAALERIVDSVNTALTRRKP